MFFVVIYMPNNISIIDKFFIK